MSGITRFLSPPLLVNFHFACMSTRRKKGCEQFYIVKKRPRKRKLPKDIFRLLSREKITRQEMQRFFILMTIIIIDLIIK